MSWLPIESNPDVMNKYMSSLGISNPDVEVVDVYGVDEEFLGMVPQPVYGVALVYPISNATEKYLKEKTNEQTETVKAFRAKHHFFYTKQVVGNACGTIAMMHLLLNNADHLGEIEKGSVMDKYLHPEIRGNPDAEAIGNVVAMDDSIKEAHAEAATEGHSANAPEDTPIYLHFVVFIRVGDECVELDGRQDNPILHGSCNSAEEFLRVTGKAIKERMLLNPDSIEYGITALVQKQK